MRKKAIAAINSFWPAEPRASVAFDLPTQIGYDSDDPMSWAKLARSVSRSIH